MKESNVHDIPDRTKCPSSKRSYEDDDAQDSGPMIKKRRFTDSLVPLSDQDVLEPSITTGPLEDTPEFNYTEPVTNLSMEEEEVDDQLAEELSDYNSQAECCIDVVQNPIPLLTPPGTPIPIKSDESVVEIYEWPCNLTVDNAFQSAIKLRSLSPMSLAKLEDVNRREEDFDMVPFRKVRTVTRDFFELS